MALRWRANDGPLIVVFGSSLQQKNNKQKNVVNVGPPLTKLSGSAYERNMGRKSLTSDYSSIQIWDVFVCTWHSLIELTLYEYAQ